MDGDFVAALSRDGCEWDRVLLEGDFLYKIVR